MNFFIVGHKLTKKYISQIVYNILELNDLKKTKTAIILQLLLGFKLFKMMFKGLIFFKCSKIYSTFILRHAWTSLQLDSCSQKMYLSS